jgi:DNA-binding transcriptional LysR family regulator
MRIDLNSLRLFRAVFDEGSLTRAAKHAHIAPSALSKRISDLEAEFGLRLFNREARGVVPTDAGEALARNIRLILANVAQMEQEMADLARGNRGHVRLRATVSAIEGYLSVDLSAFAQANPGVSVDLQDSLSAAAIDAVRGGEADLGVSSGPPPPAGLLSLPYRQQDLVAVLPAGHALAARSRVTMADILKYEMVCARSGSALDLQLQEAASALGRTIRHRIRVSGYDGMVDIVGAGSGAIGVAPDNCVRAHIGGRVVMRPLDEVWARRRLHICWGEAGAANPSAMLLGAFLASRAEAAEAA